MLGSAMRRGFRALVDSPQASSGKGLELNSDPNHMNTTLAPGALMVQTSSVGVGFKMESAVWVRVQLRLSGTYMLTAREPFAAL